MSISGGVLLLSMLLSACSFQMDEETAGTQDLIQWCDDDGDCMDGLVCDLQVNVCVDPEPEPMKLGFRLVPSADTSAAIEEQYSGLSLDESTVFNLVLHRPVRVLGKVNSSGSYQGGDILVVATAPGDIAAKPYYSDSKPLSVQAELDSFWGDANFELFLHPEKTYNIQVYQLDAQDGVDLPPFHTRRQFKVDTSLDIPSSTRWEIVLPAPEEYLEVKGRLIESKTEARPVAGARVFLNSSETGDVSTTGQTDEEGWFVLRVQPPPDNPGMEKPLYRLHVQPSDVNSLVPNVVVDEAAQILDDMDLGDIETGYIGEAVPAVFTVQDESGLFLAERMGESVIRISGALGLGTLVVEGVVDSGGRLALSVPPGEYVATVIPPSNSDLALLQTPVTVSADKGEKTFSLKLEKRLQMRGWVFSPDESPVEGAKIKAVFSGKGAYPMQSPLPARKFETVTDDEGAYTLALDPGQYVLIVDPPISTGLPRKLVPYLFISSSEQRTIWLDTPVAVSGKVEGYPALDLKGNVVPLNQSGVDEENGSTETTDPNDKQPISGVKIEIFSLKLDEDSAASEYPIGEGWTGDDGRYLLLLPNQ